MATETAAEQYARIKETTFESFLDASFSNDSLKGVDLFEVKAPSGMVFKCRKLDVAYASNAGAMPMVLSEQMLLSQAKDKAEDAVDPVDAVSKMTSMELRANMQLSAQMVRYVCIEPRLIIGEVNGHKNAISVDALTMADFGHLASWAQSGGGGADSLKTFRKRRK